MEHAAGTMTDLVFDVEGRNLPRDYSFPLLREIRQHLPWLESVADAGIHPLRGALTADGALVLARRAKLVLRLPESLMQDALALCGAVLVVEGEKLTVAGAKQRRLLPFATLYAHFVAAASDDEQAFTRDIEARLEDLQTPCMLVCGRRRVMRTDGQDLVGFSLMLHGLAPEHSLLLQQVGLGGNRAMGCGIFVRHKAVAAVG